jgi:hypothetical protein
MVRLWTIRRGRQRFESRWPDRHAEVVMVRSKLPLIALAGAGLLAAGGGGGSPAGTTPVTPTTTLAPTPAPTPQPQATPFDCNRSTFSPGPVATYQYKLKVIRRGDQVIQSPPEGAPFPLDSAGRIRVRVGDFLAFDSTQKNSAGNLCQWRGEPVWRVNDPGDALRIRSESSRETNACGFLLRVDVVNRGEFTVRPEVEGVTGVAFFNLGDPLTLIAER